MYQKRENCIINAVFPKKEKNNQSLDYPNFFIKSIVNKICLKKDSEYNIL